VQFDQQTPRHLDPITQKPSGASLVVFSLVGLIAVALIGAVAAAIHGWFNY
jgi:hypothetical protein